MCVLSVSACDCITDNCFWPFVQPRIIFERDLLFYWQRPISLCSPLTVRMRRPTTGAMLYFLNGVENAGRRGDSSWGVRRTEANNSRPLYRLTERRSKRSLRIRRELFVMLSFPFFFAHPTLLLWPCTTERRRHTKCFVCSPLRWTLQPALVNRRYTSIGSVSSSQ